MKSLLLTTVCILGLGAILAGCTQKAPSQIDQPVEATTTKTDSGLGGGQAGGGIVGDFEIDR
ncbi:MAG: hypothetical protein IH945_04925 [Armatimonadetes bacterium]|nr:hypothetical protein [Armatimonadota bacterium]